MSAVYCLSSRRFPIDRDSYLVCLEGGGTRSQAVLLDGTGELLHISESTDVNTNFVSLHASQAAVLQAVTDVLATTGISGAQVSHFVSALVGPKFGPDVFGPLLPNATYHYYTERDVVFARADIYHPHGVAVVAATGASAWGMRADDGRIVMVGGWGTLLGDEGSAYAMGVSALRTAVRVYEGRIAIPTRLLDVLMTHFDLNRETFRAGMYEIAYRNPISRADIARLAILVTRLAADGDRVALQITQKVATDLANLALFATRSLFERHESFDVAAAGGLLNAGDLILAPLEQTLAEEFPHARLTLGKQEPAVALGRLALHKQFRPTNASATGLTR